jgi:hypothetical protein
LFSLFYHSDSRKATVSPAGKDLHKRRGICRKCSKYSNFEIKQPILLKRTEQKPFALPQQKGLQNFGCFGIMLPVKICE